MRAYDRFDDDGSDRNRLDEMDIFGIMLPITLDGMKITPWGAWAKIGGESGWWDYQGKGFDQGFESSTNAYYGGLGYELNMFDPLTFSFDVIYGRMQGNQGTDGYNGYDNGNWKSNPGSSGWFVDAALRYKMDWATAGLFGWWSSGDSANSVDDGKFGRLPSLSTDTGFAPTTFGFDGSPALISSDKAISSSGIGMWGIGVELTDISFIEDLSHSIRFAYYRGTNDEEVVENNMDILRDSRRSVLVFGERQYMTTKDQAFEINFDHKYQMYENLALFLELGYIRMDLDEDVWGDASRRYNDDTDDAWKAQLSFQFKF